MHVNHETCMQICSTPNRVGIKKNAKHPVWSCHRSSLVKRRLQETSGAGMAELSTCALTPRDFFGLTLVPG